MHPRLKAQRKEIIAIAIILAISIYLTCYIQNFMALRIALTLFLIGIGIYILLINYMVYNDLFTPIGIMGPIWFITIGVANLQLSSYQKAWDVTTWIILLGSITIFLIGCLTAAAISTRLTIGNTNSKLQEFSARYEPRKIRYMIYYLFICSLIAYLVQVLKLGYIPIFGNDLIQAYLDFPEPIWYYLMVPSMFVCILAYLYVKLYKPRRKLFYYCIILMSLGMLISTLSRVFVLFVIVGLLLVKNYYGKSAITIKQLSIVLLITLLFFIVIGNIRTSGIENNIIGLAQLQISPSLSFLAWPYYSLALNIENLRILVNNLDHYYYGAKTFFPILFFARVYKYIDYEQYIIPEKISTTSTYLADFYTDFGIIGTILIPYILGILSTVLYYRLKLRPTLTNLLLYSIFVFALLFSFLLNFFARQWIFVLIVLCPIIDYYCRRRTG
jgi:oligosaccharide repeat unit polymerase